MYIKRTVRIISALLACVIFAISWGQSRTEKAATKKADQTNAGVMPKFQADPTWPKLPSKWAFGLASGIYVDPQDHVWVLYRPGSVAPEQKGMAAPPVVEFDTAGNLIQAWGGPGAGYEWPVKEHGISIDYKGYVWIAGDDRQDNQLLKFTKDGKFVMQIGRKGKSNGMTDTKGLSSPQDAAVYPKTNEVFVGDGMLTGRVIVFDADTGAFKRMWTAYGNPPTDVRPEPAREEGPGAQVFGQPHGVRVSNDGLVYVCDRGSQRIQVFTVDGKYVNQVFISRDKAGRDRVIAQALAARPDEMPFGKPLKLLYEKLAEVTDSGATAIRTGFSQDPQQRFLYVADRSSQQIVVLERKTLKVLGSFGQAGEKPGEFYILHDIALDSKGNMYTAEVNDHEFGSRRAQKFVFEGMSSASSK
jgi:DNA-binding beta-propeller fold protein YncE